jgi:hypothetical protein
VEILKGFYFRKIGAAKNSIPAPSVEFSYPIKSRWCTGLRIAVVALLAFYVTPCFAQTPVAPEYQIKAAFLYKFCNYIEWPPEAFSSESSPLKIGVAGSGALVDELRNTVRGLTIKSRHLLVQQVNSDDVVQDLQVLFIARSENQRMTHLLTLARGYPVLLVTEVPPGIDAGSVINFVVQENRVRFDISQAAAAQQGLKLSAQLLKVARNVQKDEPQ